MTFKLKIKIVLVFIFAFILSLIFVKKSSFGIKENEIQSSEYSSSSKLLTDDEALQYFESTSFKVETASSREKFLRALDELNNITSVINLDHPSTSLKICNALYFKDAKDLVNYDSFIRNVISNQRCKENLFERLASFLNKEEGLIVKLTKNGEVVFNSNFKIENEGFNIINGGNLVDDKIVYGHELPLNHVALTFDDGPSEEYTELITQILDLYSAKATFFLIGNSANRYSEISQKIYSEGNSIGSHSLDHLNLANLEVEEGINNIVNGHNLVQQILNIDSDIFQKIFRFPYGATFKELQNQVVQSGFTTFFWNVDSEDWKITDPNLIKENVMGQFNMRKTGAIFLMHDIHIQTVFALPKILEELLERDVVLVKLVD